MSTLMSIVTGNFTVAATWALCDPTAELDSEAGNTALTTSYVASAAFTPGAITIDGIAVKVASRIASPTGTVSVALALNATPTTPIVGTEVTIDGTDINVGGYSWVFFKFASPVLLLVATAYNIIAKYTTGTAPVNLYRDATAGNWSRQLRTTTTQAPAAGDKLLINGEQTGAGTSNAFTVTMNEILTTDYGTGTAIGGLYVGLNSTLTWGTTAATNYNLRLSGDLRVASGGTYNMGTVATPIPSTSTAKLEFDCAASGDFGFIAKNGSAVNIQGNALTYDRALLAADNGGTCSTVTTTVTRKEGTGFTGKSGTMSINGVTYTISSVTNNDTLVLTATAGTQTNVSYVFHSDNLALTTDVSTGWVSGDAIAVASTSRTYTHCENGTLNGAAVGTALTINGFAGNAGGILHGHMGTSPIQAEIINLTRNVKITVVTTSATGYIYFDTTVTVDMDWSEVSYMGSNVATKYGIQCVTTTGSANIQRCSVHDGYNALYLSSSTYNNITFSNNVCYKFFDIIINISATSGTNLTFDNNILMYNTGASRYGFNLSDIGGNFTNNTVVGISDIGVLFNENDVTIGTFSGNTVHSCAGNGIYMPRLINSTLSTSTVWRCSGTGIFLASPIRGFTIDTAILFGNTTSNLGLLTTVNLGVIINGLLKNVTSNGDSTFSTTSFILVNYCSVVDWILENCDFSTVSGIKTAHTFDIQQSLVDNRSYCTMTLRNCKLAATTEVANQTNMLKGSYVKSQKHNQTVGNHKSWFKYGTITTDTTAGLFKTASPSERLTPNDASNKLESGPKRVAVVNGATVTPAVWVRESVVGDGTDYNGNRIRLIVKKNVAAGIAADAVLATATVSSEGAFQQISGTTAAVTDDAVLEFVVDCDGTTGWINDDDWSVA